MEIWKDIKNYENHYQVSNLGRVKSLKHNKERILKLNAGTGYYRVTLSLNTNKCYFVHQLVAIAFLNHKIKGEKVINHIDGNRLNNNINNLEIVTQRENVSKAYEKINTKCNYIGVQHNTNNSYTSHIIFNKKNYNLGTYNTAIEAFNEYNNALSQLDIDFIGYYKILKCKNKSKPYCKRTIKNKYDNKHVYSNGFII